MLARLFALFLIVPVIELALLIFVGDSIGFLPTIGFIILTAIAGSLLVKREGLSVWRRFNDRLSTGEMPKAELVDGVIVLLAGALLVAPGVLTDVAGILGLLPFTRPAIRRQVMKRVQKRIDRGAFISPFFTFYNVSDRPEENYDAWGGNPAQRPEHSRREDEV